MNSASGSTGGRILLANGQAPKSVGIIHCVGSRDERHNQYCSRVCCMYALKFAHLIKEKTEAEVYNFYIDMRCFGKGYEEFYHRLLEEEVRFIRGRAASVSDFPLNDHERNKLIIRVEDTLIGQVRRIPVDMVVLATGLEPVTEAAELARTFHISCGNGFFTERHPKLAPVSTPTDGIFIAGACQGPKDIPDTVAQASAAASQVQSLMARGEIEVESATSMVDEQKCAGCRICNTLCSLSAISFDEERHISVINDVLCKGCGTCAAACPSAAIIARHFTDEQLFAEIEGALYDVRA
jgi:heterodisulfide reductase subunit A